MMRRLLPSLFFAPLLIAGCGGSGSSGASRPTPVFVTDDLNPRFDSVWVTIREISIFRDGRSIGGVKGVIHRDLAALHDVAGPLFSYLGETGVSVQSGDRIHVEFEDIVHVLKHGETTFTVATFEGADASTHRKGYDYYAAHSDMGTAGLRVACDLSNWHLTDAGLLITDPGSVGGSTYTGEVRHPRDACSGLATGKRTYTGGRFSLDIDGVAVAETFATQVYNADGSPSPSITEGSRLTATGRYSDASGRFEADSIVIDTPGSTPPAFCTGTISSVPGSDGSFDVKVSGSPSGNARLFVRFQPDQRVIAVEGGTKVAPSELTKILVMGGIVDAEGTFDEKGNFTYTMLHAADPEGPIFSGVLKIKTKSNIKNDFVVNAHSTWYGFDSSPDADFRVSPTNTTVWTLDGNPVTADAFKDGDIVTATFKTKPKGSGTVSHASWDLATMKGG